MIIKCQHCSANLRVPENRGWLNVTCPKCGTKFQFNSGAKTAGASPVGPTPVRQTPPKRVQPTPPEPVQPTPVAPTPVSPTPVGLGADGKRNELDDYRPGGRLRMELPSEEKLHALMNKEPMDAETLLSVLIVGIADFVGRYLVKMVEIQEQLQQEARQKGSDVMPDWVMLDLGEIDFGDVRYFRFATSPSYSDRYTYNEIMKVDAAPIKLNQAAINVISRMAHTKLADARPDIRMEGGRIYTN